MTNIIVRALLNSGNQVGEASLEFLLALALGKLRLQGKHLRWMVEQLESQEHPMMRFFADALAQMAASNPEAATDT